MPHSTNPKIMTNFGSTEHSASSSTLGSNDGEIVQAPFTTSISSVPVTVARKPFFSTQDSPLVSPGTARADVAADVQHPEGTTKGSYADEHRHQTVLQQHIVYWDPDGDGVIWPTDIYSGCRRFGWNVLLSFFAAYIISLGLSYPTQPNYFPDPLFRIYIDRIHKAKHGSDTGTYDNEGRFRPQQFEDVFAKYDRGDKGGLTLGDIWIMLKGYRVAFDFFGWSAVALEWVATYLVIWPEDGLMRKDDVRGCYDGSLFFRRAKELEQKKTKRRWDTGELIPGRY